MKADFQGVQIMVGGSIVDNFMDKLAEKISAQDIIRGNLQAEAAESQRIRQEAEQYKLQLEELKENNKKQMDKIGDMLQDSKALSEKLDENSTKVHDVGVQIYRNVQAEIQKNAEETSARIEELGKRIDSLEASLSNKKSGGVTAVAVLTLIAALAGIAVTILIHFGIF